MNQIMQGTIIKSLVRQGSERTISFEFPLKGYGKASSLLSSIKKLYEKSFLHDFQNVLTSKVA